MSVRIRPEPRCALVLEGMGEPLVVAETVAEVNRKINEAAVKDGGSDDFWDSVVVRLTTVEGEPTMVPMRRLVCWVGVPESSVREWRRAAAEVDSGIRIDEAEVGDFVVVLDEGPFLGRPGNFLGIADATRPKDFDVELETGSTANVSHFAAIPPTDGGC